MVTDDTPNEGNLSKIRRDRLATVFDGAARYVHVYDDANTVRRGADELAEQERILGTLARRLYYNGDQYDQSNAIAEMACKGVLPEHKRLHAYSTQIQECVDYLANRLGAGFSVHAKAPEVQKVIDAATHDNDTVSSLDDEGNPEIVADDILRDALVAGDVPVLILWDDVEGEPVWQFWEAESVTFVMGSQTDPIAVVRTETVWLPDTNTGQVRERTEQVVYTMAMHIENDPADPGSFRVVSENECKAETWLDGEETPYRTEWLGIGVIPWRLVRGDKKSLRGFRGEPLMTKQAMETADRYNAVEQTGYLISRYNSHANVAVIGDAASLKLETDGRISKDVADVLSFPGGTSLQVLELPTDPKMIEHQRDVLAEALYSAFGVTRSDPATIQNMGQVSGYALEILNQKTAATFDRLARRVRKDMIGLIDTTLDITAWKGGLGTSLQDQPDQWWDIDPDTTFPNRTISLQIGSGDVVDDARVRDDFIANLISREEALRQRGYGDKQIKKIVGEIKADQPAPSAPESGAFSFSTGTGQDQQQQAPAGQGGAPDQNGSSGSDPAVVAKTGAGSTLNKSQLAPSSR